MEGESFISSDLYAPNFKELEARLLAAITAEYGCLLLKLIPGKHSSTEKWKKMERFISALPIGSRNKFLMVMFFYFSTACMAQTNISISDLKAAWLPCGKY